MTEMQELDLTWQDVSAAMCRMVEDAGQWCGAPMPVERFYLSIADGMFPQLNGVRFGDGGLERREELDERNENEGPRLKWINSWRNAKWGAAIHIFAMLNGKRLHFVDYEADERAVTGIHRLTAGMATHHVHDPQAELKAMLKLRDLVEPNKWGMYVLHGVFLETSKKSGVTYIFRKGRPTVALRPDADGMMKILTCLCLHGVAYYEETFIGALVPTDDVIAHLILMRTKEHFFWRKANHHEPHEWQSGL